MTHIPMIVGAVIGLLLALALGSGILGFVLLVLAGAAGGALALRRPKGAEGIYWIFVGLTVLMFVLALVGLSVSGLVMMLPLTLAAGYFVARLTMRLTGQYKALSSD